MQDVDAALLTLHNIITEFKTFCEQHGAASETDTRVKVIDRVLKEVCGWPEQELSREDHVESGFIDYQLRLFGRPLVAVEAKREGIAFKLPLPLKRTTLKLNGTLYSDKEIKAAIDQVRAYCDDAGIRYAIATNGYAWIVFRAVRDDIPWKEGEARVFPSLEYIEEHFTDFWNLLSYDALQGGSLNNEFGSELRTSRSLHRVLDTLFNSDLPLKRNTLNTALQPLIKLVFEDIADQDHLEVLQSCYVHTGSLVNAANDIDHIITEAIPKSLEREGVTSVGIERATKGLVASLAGAVNVRKGELFVLLGGIGSGKSTFLKRYQRTTGAELLASQTLYFSIDFLKAPIDPTTLESFVWESILTDLRSRYKQLELEKLKHLHVVFEPNITALRSTALLDLKPGTHQFQRALSPYIMKWQAEPTHYVPSLVTTSCLREARIPVIFIDNVDQLGPAYQAQIFLLAQRITRVLGSITLVALREESYYTTSVQKSFTAYTSRKFHIASPHFRRMIGNRIKYCIRVLEKRASVSVDLELLPFARSNIGEFLSIIEYSIFGANRNIVRLIEALCHGNMRLALDMFTTFMTSGATDVDKMLYIAARDGKYNVGFHEFVKSVMLRDRQYYKEDESPVMNIFNVGSEKNSSHFTAWRILLILLAHRSETTTEGRGYVPITKLVSFFESTFDNLEDMITTLNRLVTKHLVEVNTRSTENVEGASHVRVTSSGWYYVNYLAKSFAYLDLVFQDTPLDDDALVKLLRQAVYDVENLGDREEFKFEKTKKRGERVNRFLDYLSAQEANERKRFALTGLEIPGSAEIMPSVREQFQHELAWIERRLKENREKCDEEAKFVVSDVEPEIDAKLVDDDGEKAGEKPSS